jgi:hypothetical protein
MKTQKPAQMPVAKLLVASNDFSVSSRLEFYLSVMASDGQISGFERVPEGPDDVPEDILAFEELRDMHRSDSFEIRGRGAAGARDAAVEGLKRDYGTRVKLLVKLGQDGVVCVRVN